MIIFITDSSADDFLQPPAQNQTLCLLTHTMKSSEGCWKPQTFRPSLVFCLCLSVSVCVSFTFEYVWKCRNVIGLNSSVKCVSGSGDRSQRHPEQESLQKSSIFPLRIEITIFSHDFKDTIFLMKNSNCNPYHLHSGESVNVLLCEMCSVTDLYSSWVAMS